MVLEYILCYVLEQKTEFGDRQEAKQAVSEHFLLKLGKLRAGEWK